MRRIGQVRITYELLEQAIGLPSGSAVVAIVPQEAFETANQCFSVMVSGPDMPEKPEGAIPEIVTPSRWRGG